MGITMGTASVDEKGRILIPKEMRTKLGLRPDRKLRVEQRGEEIIIRPVLSVDEVSAGLKGCVRGSRLHPLDLKRIWGMENDDR
jgi:AbrB family looped-hinge helix DNA binding protein